MRDILVLEDDEAQRELTGEMLEKKIDYEVDTSDSPENVENRYHITVTDYTGIDIDEAYETADNVILYTGHDEDMVDVPEDVEYVQKGRGYDELIEEVEERMGNINIAV